MASSVLSQMGIDVWTLRSESSLMASAPIDADALVAEPQAQGAVPEVNPTQRRIAEAVAPMVGGPTQEAPRPRNQDGRPTVGMASLDLLRQQLGNGASGAAAKKAPAVKPTNPIETAEQGSTSKVMPVSSDEVDEFLFLFIDYSDHSLVVSLPYGSAGLPGDYRFFIDDIDRALKGGSDQTRQVDIQMRDMSWPMLKAAHIQHSLEDAQALVLQRMKPSKNLVIVFGDLPRKYLSAIEPDIKDKQLIYAESIEHYFKVAGSKKQLWKLVKPLMAGLKAGSNQ